MTATARFSALALSLTLASLFAGCSCEPSSHTSSDAAASADAAVIAVDALPPDALLPDAMTPPPACADEDARGEGACRAIVGWAYRGGVCAPLFGCECVGEDCDHIANTEAECQEAHRACPRFCGGLAEIGCLDDEFCDFPPGSYCGGDDSGGVCTPRPTGCPDPGGDLVCGCDGHEYIGECAAHLAGVSVAEEGWCVTSHAYRTARAMPDCAPWDGGAWTFTITTERSSCEEERTDGTLTLMLWEGAPAVNVEYTLDGDTSSGGGGRALVCGRGPEDCTEATGTLVLQRFEAGVAASLRFDIRTEDGRRFAESEVPVDEFWCGELPRCG